MKDDIKNIKCVILAGGYGTRISEETLKVPKPMVTIGDVPIMLHIMRYYYSFGVNDFIICAGYKADLIKAFFANYMANTPMLTFDSRLDDCNPIIEYKVREKWRVRVVDTGVNTMTGGRLKRIESLIKPKENFFATYGDGLSDVNINDLFQTHLRKKRIATVTSVMPSGRFGALNTNSFGDVTSFNEKPRGDGHKINGGYFVLNHDVFDHIHGDDTVFEDAPLSKLAANGELVSYEHDGFWKPMDTLKDKTELEELLKSGGAKWIRN